MSGATHLTLAKMCRDIYEKDFAEKYGAKTWTHVDLKGAEIPTEDGVIFCFRGSDNLENWIRNLHVGQGFGMSALHFWGGMVTKDIKADRVIFTGHSLGGALAIILAHWLGTSRSDMKLEAITFGAPSVAKSDFYDSERVSLVEYVNGYDPVPTILDAVYQHARQRVHIGRRAWITEAMLAMYPHVEKAVGIYDHGSDRYVQSMEHLLTQEGGSHGGDYS